MRTASAIISLLLVSLVGCSRGPTVSTTAPPTTATSTIHSGFAIYLIARDVPPDQLAILSHLDLESAPLLTSDDLASYAKDTHEISLTATGVEAIRSLPVPVSGKSFAVCVDGLPVYAGAFWVAYSSLIFDGVVMDTTLVAEDHPVIRIELGYPGADFFRGSDPRSDPRILQALEQAGKLR